MINADLVAGVLTVDGVKYKIGDLIPNKPVVERPSDAHLGISVLSTGECLRTDNALNERDAMGLWSSTCEGARLIADRMQLVKRYEDFIAEQNAAHGWVFSHLSNADFQEKYIMVWAESSKQPMWQPAEIERSQRQINKWHFGHSGIAEKIKAEFQNDQMCLILTGEVMSR